MHYLIFKYLHILSATLLFGTGIGSAFYICMAHRSQNTASIDLALRYVVRADWLFIVPAIVIQLITGLMMFHEAGFEWEERWILWGLIFYLLMTFCWLLVIGLQMKMSMIAKEALDKNIALPARYHLLKRWRMILSAVIFLAIAIAIYLMIAKPD